MTAPLPRLDVTRAPLSQTKICFPSWIGKYVDDELEYRHVYLPKNNTVRMLLCAAIHKTGGGGRAPYDSTLLGGSCVNMSGGASVSR